MIIAAVTGPLSSATASLWVWKGSFAGAHAAFIIQGGCGAPDVTLEPPAHLFFFLSLFLGGKFAQDNLMFMIQQEGNALDLLIFCDLNTFWGINQYEDVLVGVSRFNCLFAQIHAKHRGCRWVQLKYFLKMVLIKSTFALSQKPDEQEAWYACLWIKQAYRTGNVSLALKSAFTHEKTNKNKTESTNCSKPSILYVLKHQELMKQACGNSESWSSSNLFKWSFLSFLPR